MLFHEIFGSYYQAAAHILTEAVNGRLTEKTLNAIVQERAFGESLLTIPDGLKGGKWKLLRKDFSTPLQEVPSMPLTLPEKRWMKALLLDPRIQLFHPDMTGLEDVDPLFTPDMLVYYDRYSDGDDYENPAYIRHFQTILQALGENRRLHVSFESRLHARPNLTVMPSYLEYSEKDDRFRLAAAGFKRHWIINLSRITECSFADQPETVRGNEAVSTQDTSAGFAPSNAAPAKDTSAGSAPSNAAPAESAQTKTAPAAPVESVTFELEDRRNAMERVLLHFSHLEKETKRLDEHRYRVTLKYDRRDETEMVIRILSFGPAVRVTEPAHFISLLRERIKKQERFSI